MDGRPGVVVLFGSGETSPSGRRAHEWVFARLSAPLRVAVLETPAGFQPNSAQVAGKVADFLGGHLQNYHPEVVVVPARGHGTGYDTDDPTIAAPLLQAGAIFLGPGSPTYAVRHLAGSLAWDYVLASHRLGSALILASAAAIAVSRHALPVYEIYKVGSDLGWVPGLDLFGPFGLSLAVVPHWDNAEGGAELDTSRCFMGVARFERLLAMLPVGATVVGIDEHTALAVDLAAGECRTMGRGGVTVLGPGGEARFASEQTFPLAMLGPFLLPGPSDGLPPAVFEAALAVRAAPAGPSDGPPPEVTALVAAREAARARRDWPEADALRQRIAALGWQVLDTRDGPILQR